MPDPRNDDRHKPTWRTSIANALTVAVAVGFLAGVLHGARRGPTQGFVMGGTIAAWTFAVRALVLRLGLKRPRSPLALVLLLALPIVVLIVIP